MIANAGHAAMAFKFRLFTLRRFAAENRGVPTGQKRPSDVFLELIGVTVQHRARLFEPLSL